MTLCLSFLLCDKERTLFKSLKTKVTLLFPYISQIHLLQPMSPPTWPSLYKYLASVRLSLCPGPQSWTYTEVLSSLWSLWNLCERLKTPTSLLQPCWFGCREYPPFWSKQQTPRDKYKGTSLDTVLQVLYFMARTSDGRTPVCLSQNWLLQKPLYLWGLLVVLDLWNSLPQGQIKISPVMFKLNMSGEGVQGAQICSSRGRGRGIEPSPHAALACKFNCHTSWHLTFDYATLTITHPEVPSLPSPRSSASSSKISNQTMRMPALSALAAGGCWIKIFKMKKVLFSHRSRFSLAQGVEMPSKAKTRMYALNFLADECWTFATNLFLN